jgi:hypothetical protein
MSYNNKKGLRRIQSERQTRAVRQLDAMLHFNPKNYKRGRMTKTTIFAALAACVIAGSAQAQQAPIPGGGPASVDILKDAEGKITGSSEHYEAPAPPPKQPHLAMYDWALDKANPFIAVNDPVKDGHAAPKGPEYNHDGRAFGFVQPVGFYANGVDYGDSQQHAAQYEKNVKSGKWKQFANGEDTQITMLTDDLPLWREPTTPGRARLRPSRRVGFRLSEAPRLITSSSARAPRFDQDR